MADVTTVVNWQTVAESVEQVATGEVKRIDGNGWIVYKVEKVVRIDIRVEE